jgi:hypothetical protein
MGAVRGSSSRRGSRALRELVAQVESGRDIAITPDGPRGPRYSLGSGAISLAQLTATSIVPMHAKFSRCFRMKSWDGFIVPLPFSKVRITVDDSISVPRELSNEQFEASIASGNLYEMKRIDRAGATAFGSPEARYPTLEGRSPGDKSFLLGRFPGGRLPLRLADYPGALVDPLKIPLSNFLCLTVSFRTSSLQSDFR